MIEKKNIALESAVLVGVITKDQDEKSATEYLDELEFLTFTAGGKVLKRFVQKMTIPNPKTFIGTGKMEEVENYIKEIQAARMEGRNDSKRFEASLHQVMNLKYD